jgi:hypothetical protein
MRDAAKERAQEFGPIYLVIMEANQSAGECPFIKWVAFLKTDSSFPFGTPESTWQGSGAKANVGG